MSAGGARQDLAPCAGLRLDRLAPAFSCLLCLLPLLLFWSRFANLYWFHDDWELTSQMQSLPFREWLVARYGENFSPVFNAAWYAAIRIGSGSYIAMILAVWATHLANLLLLAAILRHCGFAWQAQSIAVVTLGMAWSNIETLGWAACWISLLSILWFLFAWWLLLAASRRGSRYSTMMCSIAAVICALASALTFSRGVLSGVLLAFFVVLSRADSFTAADQEPSNLPAFFPSFFPSLTRWQWPTGIALCCVTAVALIPYRWMLSGYHNFADANGSELGAMASYGVHYYLLSPLFHLLPIPHKTVALRELMIAGVCKALVVACAIWLSKERARALLWILLLLDLGMAVMLALGRYRFDMETSVSYRYQYVSLLCFAPCFAVVVMKGLGLLRRTTARHVAFAVLFVGWALLLGYPWKRHSQRWSQWRGTEAREALAAAQPEQLFGLPTITAARARELIRIYGLH